MPSELGLRKGSENKYKKILEYYAQNREDLKSRSQYNIQNQQGLNDFAGFVRYEEDGVVVNYEVVSGETPGVDEWLGAIIYLAYGLEGMQQYSPAGTSEPSEPVMTDEQEPISEEQFETLVATDTLEKTQLKKLQKRSRKKKLQKR